MMAGRHIAISTWLDALHMQEYHQLFQSYRDVEDLVYSTEADITELGINCSTHRGKIVSSLRALRDKYERGSVKGSGVLSIQPSPSTPLPNSPTSSHISELNHVFASSEKLQLDLHKEFSGDPSELRTRPWYHGTITRQRAEWLVSEANGNFLVRDCISSPGDFVLTCWWNGTPLNFMINAIVGTCSPGQLPSLSYKFEEEAFPSIQQLVAFYQIKDKPVTVVSGALLKNAVARCMPLSYYDTKYGASTSFTLVEASRIYRSTPAGSPKPSPFVTPDGSPEESPDMNKRAVSRTGSHPVLVFSGNESGSLTDNRPNSLTSSYRDSSAASGRSHRAPYLDRCDSFPIISITPPVVGRSTQRPDYTASFGSSSGSNRTSHGSVQHSNKKEYLNGISSRLPKPFTPHMRAGSAPALTPMEDLERRRQLQSGSPNTAENESAIESAPPQPPPPPPPNDRPSSLALLGCRRGKPFGGRLVSASSEGELTNPPPPKPSRIPSVKYKQKPRVVIRQPAEMEDDDRDYSDYFQVKEAPSWVHGDTGYAPKFRDDPPKRLALSSLVKTDSQSNKLAVQIGRRANRLAQEGKNLSSTSDVLTITTPQQRSQLSSPSMTKHLIRNAHPDKLSPESHSNRRDGIFSTSPMMRVPPIHPSHDKETLPMTPTYQIVDRSRSFQSGKPQSYFNFGTGHDNDMSNNMNNAKNKGYKTLPNRPPRPKVSHPRKISDQSQMVGDGETTNDYDVPREHGDEEMPQIFNVQNSNNNTNNNYINNNTKLWRYREISQPPKYFPTSIKPESFTCNLLPKGHKALDQTVLLRVKKLLLSKSPRQLAMTLTHYDLQLFKVTGNTNLGMGVHSGLELLTLPQGKQLRQDGLERWDCLRLFVMMTLLACPTVSERAGLLSLWIQTCLELKGGASEGQESKSGSGGAGNLFSFAAVMSGLCGEPVWRLTDTWLILRQMHTPSAFTFDTRLRPTLSALNDVTADLPVNRVSVPYVTPVCLLLETPAPGVASVFSNLLKTSLVKDPSNGTTLLTAPPKSSSISPNKQRQSTVANVNSNNNGNNNYAYYMEAGLDPVGGAVDVLLAHLDTARVIAAQGPLYCSTGQAVMDSFEPDQDLSAVLSAEFHMLLLWGEKGWTVGRSERVGKLQRILTLLSYRYQVPGDDGTEV